MNECLELLYLGRLAQHDPEMRDLRDASINADDLYTKASFVGAMYHATHLSPGGLAKALKAMMRGDADPRLQACRSWARSLSSAQLARLHCDCLTEINALEVALDHLPGDLNAQRIVLSNLRARRSQLEDAMRVFTMARDDARFVALHQHLSGVTADALAASQAPLH